MQQRGRRSASNLTAFPLQTAQHQVQPPPDATRTEARLFNEVVTNCHPDYFSKSDAPLLLSYVQATLAARRFAKDKASVKQWARACRVQATLARALRLTPHSRLTSSQARKAAAYRPSFYDTMDLNDAHNGRDD